MQHDTAPLLLGKNTAAGGSDRANRTALETRAARLNARFAHHGAIAVLQGAIARINRLTLVSSFGAESVVLLHMISLAKRDLPILFIDTELLFTETLVYQQELAERLNLTNIRILRSEDIDKADPKSTLHHRDPDACCALRKTRPLEAALTGFDGWITGRKRFQSGTRAELEFFEADPVAPRLKVNPLAHWAQQDVRDYIEENRLPRHPLVAKGYPSIGCAPCTSPVTKGEDLRAGRWRSQTKEECGIHFVNGKLVRQGENR